MGEPALAHTQVYPGEPPRLAGYHFPGSPRGCPRGQGLIKAHAPYGAPRATAGAASLQAWARASCVGLKSVYLKEEIARGGNMEIL